MSRWRIVVLLILLTAPVLFLSGLGGYYLWQRGWSFWASWPIIACFSLAYYLGWHWHRQQRLLGRPDIAVPLHWTERDRQAWRLVEARAKDAINLEPGKLSELQSYVAVAQEMALEISRSYRPGAKDPLGDLTIPEILAVIELAAHDMAELVDRYLPAGHLLSINNWRQARQAADWYQTATNAYWLIAAVFAPVQTGLRFAASQAGVSKPWQMLQKNLLVWFYTAYIHRLGSYLIDLNSGRLRVGADRYRELTSSQDRQTEHASAAALAAQPAAQVTITVMGQVKTGKSSFINAVLGEQRARTDVVPATAEITRYELQPEGISSRFVFLDTVGYGHTGPSEDQIKATQEAARQSDLLLLVLHARNPARQADLAMLQALEKSFVSRPELRMPPVLGILTHIDLLTPAMEWSPPYDWQNPQKPKDRQIQQALTVVRDQMSAHLAGCVPVCTADGKIYGIEEWLLPTLADLLDEAHAVALLRCLRAEADLGRVRKVFEQFLAAGAQIIRSFQQTSAK